MTASPCPPKKTSTARRRSWAIATMVAVALGSYLTLGVGRGALAVATTTLDVVGPSGSNKFGDHVVVLSNGNFVVVDELWSGPNAFNAGAVYLYNGANDRLISTLTGGIDGDKVGYGGVVEVGNSNFVVLSPAVSTTAGFAAGAVTWVNGTTGLDGVVSPSNSIVGLHGQDQVGASTRRHMHPRTTRQMKPRGDLDTAWCVHRSAIC